MNKKDNEIFLIFLESQKGITWEDRNIDDREIQTNQKRIIPDDFKENKQENIVINKQILNTQLEVTNKESIYFITPQKRKRKTDTVTPVVKTDSFTTRVTNVNSNLSLLTCIYQSQTIYIQLVNSKVLPQQGQKIKLHIIEKYSNNRYKAEIIK